MGFVSRKPAISLDNSLAGYPSPEASNGGGQRAGVLRHPLVDCQIPSPKDGALDSIEMILVVVATFWAEGMDRRGGFVANHIVHVKSPMFLQPRILLSLPCHGVRAVRGPALSNGGGVV
ncbi:hypothetical protein L484_017409 [Morus notabilis]|uniref:Uncharacterized protein n=1 Tax=Morus notabilis TaxID=981085 RepID=W9QVR0_9ROSA|nr:hypothetical protein L484_017409 [Morus notabilis]